MTGAVTALAYAVRPWVVGRYLGRLGLMLAVLNVVPLAVAMMLGERRAAAAYAGSVCLLSLGGVLARRLPEPERVQVNEGLVVVCLAFLIAPLLGAVSLSAGGLPFEDALFEAVSAVTTTGLSTAGSVADGSPLLLFSRAWMQWYGGLGIAVLSVALLMGHHAAARRLVESAEGENPLTTARTHARQVLLAYLLLTGVGLGLLWAVMDNGYAALLQILATVSTGGFSPYDGSLAALTGPARWLVTGFSMLGAVPLILYFHALSGRPGELGRDPEVRAMLAAAALVSLTVGLSLYAFSGFAWPEALAAGAQLGISAQSTTGFSPVPLTGLHPVTLVLIIIAMAVGGATGSTAGGIKLLRLLVIWRLLQFFVRRSAMPPHAALAPRLAGRALQREDVERVGLVIVAFLAAAVLSWLCFLIGGYEPLTALFEVVSALGTVGLSTGISGPDLATPLKLVLCLDMLLGRLELLALLVLVYPRTWFGKRA